MTWGDIALLAFVYVLCMMAVDGFVRLGAAVAGTVRRFRLRRDLNRRWQERQQLRRKQW